MQRTRDNLGRHGRPIGRGPSIASARRVCIVYHSSDEGLAIPTVLPIGQYRVYYYSHESNEPAHVHIDRNKASC